MASVLIVEDDMALSRAVSDALVSAGHEVREARDGIEAIRLTEERVDDIVITDLFMPRRDGFELIKQLRHLAPGICIIVMSGQMISGKADYLRMARSFGAKLTLRKPFRMAELLSAVSACGAG